MDISVIVPLLNESESLPELFPWIDKVMKANSFSYEIIAIDDGSTDNSWEVIQQQSKLFTSIRGIRFSRNYGKSAALNEGFLRAKGEVAITMDADFQDSPDEIPSLYKGIKTDDFDIISGWKKKRHDPITKTIPSKLYNGVTRWLTGIKLHDMNCGLKAYKNVVVKNVEVYGEMHRYIPVIAKWAGFKKIGEQVVQHQERKFGVTKFGLERFINGFLDLFSILFVTRFGKRPMHIFGTLGTLSFFLGAAILIYLSISKVFFDVTGMTDRPLFYFGILTLMVGVQLFSAGFVAELVSRNAPDRNTYKIRENIGFDD